MDSEITIVRIYLTEADHRHHKTLMQEILDLLHQQHRVSGAIVFRGIAGFGDSGEFRADDILRALVDLPLVIEFFDKPETVEAALAEIAGMVPPGRIVSWCAACR